MKVVEGITIDQEFKNLIPAIGMEERKQLEANIIEFGGARDPLVVWRDGDRDILIDGHNRYDICTTLGLAYRIEPMEFASRDDAADWIDRNQLGRRNLPRQDYKLLLGRRYERAKRAQGAPDGNNNAGKKQPGKSYPVERTSEKLAKEHGVTEKTVRNAGKFQAAAAKLGIEQEITSGKVKATEAAVVKAAKALPKEPTAKQVEKAREEVVAPRPKGAEDKSHKPSNAAVNRQAWQRVLKAMRVVRDGCAKLTRNRSARREEAAKELRVIANHIERDEKFEEQQATSEPEETPDQMLDEISYYAMAFLSKCPERADQLEGALSAIFRCHQKK
jgi:hypothetical protein